MCQAQQEFSCLFRICWKHMDSRNTEQPLLENQETDEIIPRRDDDVDAKPNIIENSPSSILEKKARIAGRAPPGRPTRLVKPPRLGPMRTTSPTRISPRLRPTRRVEGMSPIVVRKEAIKQSSPRHQQPADDLFLMIFLVQHMGQSLLSWKLHPCLLRILSVE
jgi:hypothetical protein